MSIFDKDIFVTGGAGTLGRALAHRRKEVGGTGKMTVYSTDAFKHSRMSRIFPDINYICGDIRNYETLYNAMVGHDIVIHAAAVKVIPVSEFNSLDTIDVNVMGSQVVSSVAIQAKVEKVLGISTDKAAHSANCYGATKFLMEKIFQEYNRIQPDVGFHLVRYGNVIESTGSVVELWQNLVKQGKPIGITDPEMTRFWISPDQAVDYVLLALAEKPAVVVVPKMKSLSIGKLAEYTVGDVETYRIPIRPGEKIHETLVTIDELYKVLSETVLSNFLPSPISYFVVAPSTYEHQVADIESHIIPFTSENAERLTKEELHELLGWKIE